MHRNGKLAVGQEERKPAPFFGFLPLLLAACQPVIARYGQQSLSLQENQATGGEIGLSIDATDADTPQDQLVWGVSDNRFELRQKSDGRQYLVLKDGETLNYEDSRNPNGQLNMTVIDLIGLEKAHSGGSAVTFSDLTLPAVTRQGGGTDTRITAGDDYLWLVENMAPTDFSADDFIEVGLPADGFA